MSLSLREVKMLTRRSTKSALSPWIAQCPFINWESLIAFMMVLIGWTFMRFLTMLVIDYKCEIDVSMRCASFIRSPSPLTHSVVCVCLRRLSADGRHISEEWTGKALCLLQKTLRRTLRMWIHFDLSQPSLSSSPQLCWILDPPWCCCALLYLSLFDCRAAKQFESASSTWTIIDHSIEETKVAYQYYS